MNGEGSENYKLRVTRTARRDLESWLDLVASYNEIKAAEYEAAFFDSLSLHVLPAPHTWAYFHITGAPLRAYLHSMSHRASFWIVYEIEEEDKAVSILRVWNAARDPRTFSKS